MNWERKETAQDWANNFPQTPWILLSALTGTNFSEVYVRTGFSNGANSFIFWMRLLRSERSSALPKLPQRIRWQIWTQNLVFLVSHLMFIPLNSTCPSFFSPQAQGLIVMFIVTVYYGDIWSSPIWALASQILSIWATGTEGTKWGILSLFKEIWMISVITTF